MIKSILNKKSIISLGATFLMVACATNDGVPQLVSSSAIQEQSEVTWNSLLESRELSASVDLTQRFERVSSQLIAESNLANEMWDIKLFKDSPSVFVLPGHQLGASETAIMAMSDDRLASMIAFGIASVELRHSEQMISRHAAASLIPVFGNSEKAKLLKQAQSIGPLPPTPAMRREATQRAEDIVTKAGFTPDFLVSTSPLNLGGPLK